MRSARALLVGAFLALALGITGAALWRSTIPRSLDTRVARVHMETEDRPGKDDVYFLTIDGRRTVVDRVVAERIHAGDHVEKRAWSRHLQVNGRSVPLGVSRDVEHFLLLMPLLGALLYLLLWPRPLRKLRP